MGRFSDALTFIRNLLEGKREETARSPWILDSLEKVMLMWPSVETLVSASAVRARSPKAQTAAAKEAGDAIFVHLRRLFRFGFRLSVDVDGLRLRRFFADGELYRPEGYSETSNALLADLTGEKNPLRVGQCRVARAQPVLNALGFPDLDTNDSYAIQFAWVGDERWIFIDSRPELFRREIAAAIAAKLAEVENRLKLKFAKPPEGPSL